MKKFDFYQIITIILSIAVIVSIGFFLYNLTQGKFGKAALSVDVEYGSGAVTVNNKDKGQTPLYTEEISAGNLEVGINGETNSYSTIITPAAGTLAVVKRDLGINDAFSSGQNIWFDKVGGDDSVISVISPDVMDVSVIVDGVEMGKAPVRFSTKDLLQQNEQDKYKLTFKKDDYEEQEVEVKVRPGYELSIRTDPFLKPITDDIEDITGGPDGVVVIGLRGTNAAFTDKQSWAKAINYWLNTRGASVLGNYNVEKFDYFVDDEGKVYNEAGNEINADEVEMSEGNYVAYLSTSQDDGLSDAAIITFAKITDTTFVQEGEEAKVTVKILPTGIGYLKVRSGPSTTNEEVARVDVGKIFVLKGEDNAWFQIEYEEGKDGWISGTYAEKIEPEPEATDTEEVEEEDPEDEDTEEETETEAEE